MNLSKLVILSTACMLLSLDIAQGGSITANYDVLGGFGSAESPAFIYAGNSYAYVADKGLGTRTDSPGPGIDSTVPANFDTFCVEIDQHLFVPASNFHANVVPLLNASTDPDGAPGGGPVFFDALRTLYLERLWGQFEPGVNNPHLAAAFQLAVWELAFDNDQTLSGNLSLLHASALDLGTVGSAAAIAEGWLAQVRDLNLALNTQTLVLLTDPSTQDLITPVGDTFITPEPTSLALLATGALGLAAYGRRRKRPQ